MNPIEQLMSVLCDPEGKCCIAGSDEDRAIIDRALKSLAEPAPMQEPETVSVYGVKSNGEVVDTCVKAPMPPRMKAKDMVREMFGPWEEDDGSDSDLCFAVCESLLDWLVAQGWTAQQPAPVQEPVKVGCLRCNTPKKCDVWGCSPNTFPSEQPATPADVPMLTDEDIHQMWLNSPFRGSGGQADWFKEGVRVGIQAVRQKAGLP